MVAVNRTFLAFSLASLSLADAAVVPSPPASPSKPGPEPSSLPSIVPLPMKRMVRERANSTPKKSRFLKSRVEEVTTPLGAAFSKRQQDQARFDVHNVPRQVEEREDKGQGHVDITSPTADGNSTRIASLLYNSTTDNLDASPDRYSTMYMVSNDPHAAQDSMPVTLQMPINSTDGTTSSYCATFDPSPPAPEPLTMTPCFTNSTAPTPHKSQTFVYNASSSVVQPMWNGTDSSVTQRDDNAKDVTLVWVQQQVQQQQEASASSSSASFAASSSSTTSASSSMAASTSASFPKPSLPVAAPISTPAKAPVGLQEFSSISATSSFVASSSQASSTASATSSSQASSASSSSAATPGAFEVHLATSSTGSTSASSTDTPPSASSSTTDAASVAAEIAQSSSSTSTSDAGPTAAAEQTVNVAARASGEDNTYAMEWKREHGL
ncbi:hypothetical protein B0H16DRAFT_956017 [Mycena metata]|uniref:Uncharacterized protein n=1 Tax=Mycena metata TaxID=1033252 RepID=A0AAD7K392_9AGAR|nr:hypothetical protein B0H16DRAFT_956017 [Mycena metata]